MDVAPRSDGWCAPSTSSSVAPAASPGAARSPGGGLNGGISRWD